MKINIKLGDIVTEDTDAIVNSSGKTLLGGGGVCGRIYRSAGKGLYDECINLRNTEKYKQGLKVGDAVITGGYELKAKYIINTLGTDIRDYKDDSWKEHLSNCYKSVLKVANENNIKSISFPLIGNGIFGLDINETSIIAIKSVKDYIDNSKSKIEVINFVIYNDNNALEIYKNAYNNIFNVI